MSDAKLKGEIFDGPQIRQLSEDDVLVIKITSTEKKAWLDSKNVVEQILGNVKIQDWKKRFREWPRD